MDKKNPILVLLQTRKKILSYYDNGMKHEKHGDHTMIMS